MASTAIVPINKVWPSGAAFATTSDPMLPPAPGRLSTMNCWLNDSESLAATSRAVTSTPPPDTAPTMIRTGRDGYGCAPAQIAANINAAKLPGAATFMQPGDDERLPALAYCRAAS